MHCCDVISLLSHPCSLNSSQSGPYFFSMGQTQFLCTRWPFGLETSRSMHDSHLLNIHDWTQCNFLRKAFPAWTKSAFQSLSNSLFPLIVSISLNSNYSHCVITIHIYLLYMSYTWTWTNIYKKKHTYIYIHTYTFIYTYLYIFIYLLLYIWTNRLRQTYIYILSSIYNFVPYNF